MTDKEDDITLILHAQTIGEERVLLLGNFVNSVRDGQILVPVLNPSGNSIEFLPPQLAKVQYDLFEGARVHLCSDSVEQSNKENRMKKLAQIIQTDHLNHEERASLWGVCKKYQYLFHLEGDALKFTTAIQHDIKT